MPRITTQQEFKVNKKLPFCYLCGEPLDNGLPINDDHCPPKSIFSTLDRANYPIVLKVHEQCNHAWHLTDDMLSLLFDPLSGQGKVEKEKHRSKMEKRKVSLDVQGIEFKGYANLPLRPFAYRMNQCMHAILYKEWLPYNIQRDVMYPFAEANNKGQLISEEICEVSLAMSKRLVSSIKADTFDCVTAYNDTFKYVCCWSTFDNGNPVCIFAFDLMKMAQMAVPFGRLPKAVIGHYAIKPPNTSFSKATKLEMSLTEEDVLYPLRNI